VIAIYGGDMVNIYCKKLQIDIDLSPLEDIRVSHTTNTMMIFEYPSVDENLKSFLKPLDMFVSRAEVFHTPANGKLPIHVDMDRYSNICKLNWVVGGGEMVWWKVKEDIPLRYHKTPIGTKYLLFEEDECEPIYREKIGLPSLVNVGVPHSINNDTDESRWCVSHNINCLLTGKQIEWYDAIRRLP
jgi:hypothetical protein